jgi:HD-GYP domain-containing protein (c-di-GMP phosphodiesterase class II)
MSTPTDQAAGRGRIPHGWTADFRHFLSRARPRLAESTAPRELWSEAIVAFAFLAAAVPLAVLSPHHGSASAGVVLLFVALYAVTSRIQFDVGTGYGPPTQLVLVPMLYALPPGSVPLVVVAGMVAGLVPGFIRGRRHPDRAIPAIADGWYAIGPAIVFILGGLHSPRWSDWPLLLAALAAQLACDSLIAAVRDWLRTGSVPKLSVRELDPVYLLDICLSPIGLAIAFAAVSHPAAAIISLPLSGLLTVFARDRRARMQTAVELSGAYRGTALLLGDVVEADDEYTGVHSRDVVELCMSVGPSLGLDEDQLRRLEFTALLHDVGKIAIPKEIINKPGKLTDEERAIIETHTIEGETLLNRVGGLLGEVGRLVRSCHERYDGLGYPDGLAGEAIPIEARIVCCCDAFNAMTTDRPYRSALSLDEAMNELRVHRGKQFDPGVVDCLLALHAEVKPAEPDPAALLPAA